MIKPIGNWDLQINRDGYGDVSSVRLTEDNLQTVINKLNEVIGALNQILPPEIGEKP